ncbi:hypothetical protein [Pseudalkalibacillus hwajinpoensis]|uniref:Uncharacterized protein n=1 Tax=Guptibacillus hwajinpoensis TaxID=208199 RepID=A0A4U1MHI3_9BACL|nr:hypothetical protein [Pseudalkalibacillus hwajinpoensis]TKD70759.1 hypothetical protein FBF83_09095 [Pseudalkalibacillus hwajinpoensis]
MKKIVSFLMIGLISVLTFLPMNQAEAAMSSWQSVYGISGCEVRVWTDYSAYTSSATTIDWYAESRDCPKLNYEASVDSYGSTFVDTPTLKGYFSYRTPIKSFYLRDLSDLYGDPGSYVGVELYKNGSLVDVVESSTFNIYNR